MKWQGDKMNMFVDIVIVGTGISGLYSALNLRSDLKILLITKTKIRESNTYLAQGGIATAKNIEDIPSHIEDTLMAGKYKNNTSAVKVLVEESMENIHDLQHFGLVLDKENGKLLYTKEGAHSTSRIVHVKDHTGKAVVDALLKKIEEKENIIIYEDTFMVDILKEKNKCCGLIALKDDEIINIHSKVVILATGGIGGLFKNSTSQRALTGDGIYIALKNNIELKDLEYIQFHPTALYKKNESERRFLISESMRGEETIGADFDWQRLRKQVLVPLANNEEGNYQRYDWCSDSLSEWHRVFIGGIVIIEGVYSTRNELADFYDFKIYVDCPSELRLKRGIERDGEAAMDMWEKIWMVAEDKYMNEHRPSERGDLVVEGCGNT